MKSIFNVLLAGAVLACSMVTFQAQAVGSHTVQGHYRSNGTYVESYQRTNPNSSVYDNYSYGN